MIIGGKSLFPTRQSNKMPMPSKYTDNREGPISNVLSEGAYLVYGQTFQSVKSSDDNHNLI